MIVSLVNGDIVQVQNIVCVRDQTLIVYHRFLKKIAFFNYPLSSVDLGIYEVAQLSADCEMVKYDSVFAKCVRLWTKDERKCICIPLAHKT